MTEISAELTKDAIELKKTDQLIVKLILEGDVEEFTKMMGKFFDLKKKIQKALIDHGTVKIFDSQAQEVLTKIYDEKLFQADKILKGLEDSSGAEFGFGQLDEEEIEKLGSDLFYSWFSHLEYIEALFEIGSLIVGISVPDNLKTYISEARNCYAFQQYNAVYGLCRIILEIAIRHRCERKGIIKRQKEDIFDFDAHRPADLINKATRGDLRTKVKENYVNSSKLLHGWKTVSADDAKKMFKSTLIVVQELYKN